MEKTTVLIIGSGGREHALAWALARSPEVEQVYVAPGNAGTNWPAGIDTHCAAAASVPVAASDTPALIAFAREKQVGLVVIGPEALLAAGIVDACQTAGLRVFGPTREAAMLETSKLFARQFMDQHDLPIPAYAAFDDYDAARHYLDACRDANNIPLVVKANGLAAGKGVSVCETFDEAYNALHRIMVEREFGAAGDTVLIEECVTGRELSLLAFCDGHTVIPMPPTRDYKRVHDGDQGPNTGGMGAYAPAPDAHSALIDSCMRTIMQPVVDGMAARGTPYIGVLYAGLMLTDSGPSVLEFNCRFGDPETQVVLPLLDSGPEGGATLFDILWACTEGTLNQTHIVWRAATCATVVLTAPGYPGSYPTNFPISGLDQTEDDEDNEVVIFHAGTARNRGHVVTAGGRVLAVSAVGDDLAIALGRAYNRVGTISFENMHYRHDIGS